MHTDDDDDDVAPPLVNGTRDGDTTAATAATTSRVLQIQGTKKPKSLLIPFASSQRAVHASLSAFPIQLGNVKKTQMAHLDSEIAPYPRY